MSEGDIKGHCSQCGQDRSADVMGHYRTSLDAHGVSWLTDFRILKCRGCDEVYFQAESQTSEDIGERLNPQTEELEQYIPSTIAHFPERHKFKPAPWIYDLQDSVLISLLRELYGALNADFGVLSAIAARTVFDRASELRGVDPAASFDMKLTDLQTQGVISREEQSHLEFLVDVGNAAAHRGWQPNSSMLKTMLSIVEAFLQRSFIIGDAAERLKPLIPPKPPRRSKPPKRP